MGGDSTGRMARSERYWRATCSETYKRRSEGGRGKRAAVRQYLVCGLPYFVVLHPEEKEIMRAQRVIASWLAIMGLELKPSKTRLSHTLLEYQGNTGFDFLGFCIRQFSVGKTQTGVHHQGKPLGFKTIITPSKANIQRHAQTIRTTLRKSQSLPQQEIIAQLNPIIYGWAMYFRTVAASKCFASCDHQLINMLWQRMRRRHPHKSARWVKNKYWRTIAGKSWTYATPEGPGERRLRQHADVTIKRHVKVKGNASPFDGKLLYWAKRLKDHPLTTKKLGRLLQRQQGKCRWCHLWFMEGDCIEIDHILPRSLGGRDTMDNLSALHRHCHDQKHAIAGGINDN
jgi:RNA-directed DNA polymerase